MFAWTLCLLFSVPTFAEVMAVDAKSASPIEAESIITAAEQKIIVDKKNIRYEFSPHSVFDFHSDGTMRLLRGSVLATSTMESSLKTTSAKVEFIGKILLSYDHKEKSTSAFVLEGQARVLNPHEADKTLLLDRFRGASMVAGDVFPQLVRQLDFASVDDWLKGYAWTQERREEILKQIPQKITVETKVAEHLKETKLDDYFAAVEETVEDRGQPEYYDKKFGNQDQVVLEANQKKSTKFVSPEQAALISLPTNKIDLGMDLPPEFVTQSQKAKELEAAPIRKKATRGIASVAKPVVSVKKEVEKADRSDPEVDAVLERLRNIKAKTPIVSQKMELPSRSPASLSQPIVPDPVYDFSQNF